MGDRPLNGHARRIWRDHGHLRCNVGHEIVRRGSFWLGEEARHYNGLQKAPISRRRRALPLMVGTGLTMSPGFNAGAPWLLDLFGGRQSARTIHFITASLVVAFIVVHLVMVLVSGVWNNIRSMITGRYAIEVGGDGQ